MRRKYIIKRILLAIPTFFGITILTYIILSLAPGTPLDAFLADPRITAAEIERRRQALGLDQSVILQYSNWLMALLKGDLGYSFSTQRPVIQMIGERLAATSLLAGASIVVSLIVSIPLGIIAASKPNSFRDYSTSAFSFFFVATPNFFMSIALIYIFSVQLKLLPSSGMYDSAGAKTNLMLLRHMVLPCLVLSFQQIGSWVRYMRNSMLEVLQEDYIRTARAKGLSKWKVIFKHGFKNSLIPVVTVVGMSVPTLVSGAVVTENVFSWPGIGTLLVQSIGARDYPVIMGITVLVAAIVLAVNIVTDLIYGLLNPKISYE